MKKTVFFYRFDQVFKSSLKIKTTEFSQLFFKDDNISVKIYAGKQSKSTENKLQIVYLNKRTVYSVSLNFFHFSLAL